MPGAGGTRERKKEIEREKEKEDREMLRDAERGIMENANGSKTAGEAPILAVPCMQNLSIPPASQMLNLCY